MTLSLSEVRSHGWVQVVASVDEISAVGKGNGRDCRDGYRDGRRSGNAGNPGYAVHPMTLSEVRSHGWVQVVASVDEMSAGCETKEVLRDAVRQH